MQGEQGIQSNVELTWLDHCDLDKHLSVISVLDSFT